MGRDRDIAAGDEKPDQATYAKQEQGTLQGGAGLPLPLVLAAVAQQRHQHRQGQRQGAQAAPPAHQPGEQLHMLRRGQWIGQVDKR